MSLVAISDARATWSRALADADVAAVVEHYAPDATLLGTIDDHRVGPRRGHPQIREYFEALLAEGGVGVEFHTPVDVDSVDELGVRYSVHAGYYDFLLPGGRRLSAKFSFVYQLSGVATPIVSHVSGLVPNR